MDVLLKGPNVKKACQNLRVKCPDFLPRFLDRVAAGTFNFQG
jgi:hypothetical protein